MTLDGFVGVLDAIGYYGDRETITNLAKGLGFEIEHDEPGQYDPSVDGFIVIKTYRWGGTKDDRLLRIDFADDSLNGGSYESCRFVTAKPVEKIEYT